MPKKKYGEKAIERAELEVWANPSPDKDYLIEITFPEFTCLCPRSGYPDFAIVKISYVPDQKVVELKSLKLWLNKFRDVHVSHEAVSNKIFDSLWNVLEPKQLKVVADFHPRGNVHTVVTIEKSKEEKEKVRK